MTSPIFVKHEVTQKIIEVPTGFSWTVLLFGCFVPLFRSDWQWFIIMLASNFVPLLIDPIIGLLLLTVIQAYFAFTYNDFYYKELLNKNYKPYTLS